MVNCNRFIFYRERFTMKIQECYLRSREFNVLKRCVGITVDLVVKMNMKILHGKEGA